MNKLTIIKPDDWHLHLRDSPYLETIVGDTAKQFGRAIVMPNLKPPITNCEQAELYRHRILSSLPEGSEFQPLMTLYLTDNTRVEDIALASASDNVYAAKLYPAGATTNSDAGVTNIQKIYPVLEAMQHAMFEGGIRPHHYCLPVPKREDHRVALLSAATGNSGRFFSGTDSAPHKQAEKESACGCAGIYSAYCAIELYAEAFELIGNFTHFEAFMSLNGPNFYQLPINTEQIILVKSEWQVPHTLDYGGELLIPFKAGETLQWSIV